MVNANGTSQRAHCTTHLHSRVASARLFMLWRPNCRHMHAHMDTSARRSTCSLFIASRPDGVSRRKYICTFTIAFIKINYQVSICNYACCFRCETNLQPDFFQCIRNSTKECWLLRNSQGSGHPKMTSSSTKKIEYLNSSTYPMKNEFHILWSMANDGRSQVTIIKKIKQKCFFVSDIFYLIILYSL